ncbi:unnamed protein product [Allacma fusca]|uniref:SCP domain-containing protein n=1 Tax=Allacma fusca TaxID=39272 RepID=A0A8J2PLW9_9HEXA|nr:unnamed protein product [Allacma fusca]
MAKKAMKCLTAFPFSNVSCAFFASTFIPILIIFLVNLDYGCSYRHERMPRVYGNRMPKSMLTTESRKVQEKIVAYHNFFRANVRPKASNMLEMSWHSGAAKAAQRWADQCQMLTHDNATDRWTEYYGPCGQNIFVATHKVPWFFALKMWNLEHRNFTYGSQKNKLSVVGHYTQMYGAPGNYMNNLGKPYNKGPPCSDCPNSCNKSSRLCTNSCPFADLWVNCHELNMDHSAWLCRDKSKEGLRRRKHCRATCHCKNKIMPKYSL